MLMLLSNAGYRNACDTPTPDIFPAPRLIAFHGTQSHHAMAGNTGNSKNSLMTIALAISIKNAPTIGTTKKARCDGPKRLVMACILAIAVGVAHSPKPQCPAASTAAS